MVRLRHQSLMTPPLRDLQDHTGASLRNGNDRFPDSHAGSGAVASGRLVAMTGADGGAGQGARPESRWDVALSFAGAQRDYVGRVAAALKARGVRCFYDSDEQVR